MKTNFFFRRFAVLLVLVALLCGGAEGFAVNKPAPAVSGGNHRDVEKHAKSLYKQAQKDFKTGQYWRCSTHLIQIVDQYPAYSKIADAIYLLGNSLYELQVFSGADKMYRYLLREVARNRYIADAILGLQKSRYQMGDYEQSLKFYKALEKHYPYFKGIDEARYYAGQIHFHRGEYAFAMNLFLQVSEGSDFYPFALYTTGLIHLKKKACRKPLRRFEKSPDCPNEVRGGVTLSIPHV